MYPGIMKHRELVGRLRALGWYLAREGGRHEIWTNGDMEEPVPRHKEINEMLARKILKTVAHNPGRDD